MAAKKSAKTNSKTPKKEKEMTKKNKEPKNIESPKTEKNEPCCPMESNGSFWKTSTILLAILLVVSVFTHGFTSQDCTPTGDVISTGTTEKVKLDFYVMSQCPYGVEVEDAIAPVLEKLGENIEFTLNFIASENDDGTFNSLHGEPEVNGDIVQLCAIKYAPETYMDMISCQNENYASIPGNWESCAEEIGLDVESIRACYEGDEGKEILKESIAKSEAIGASGSPTIYLNGNAYAGGRGENDFLRSICNAFDGDAPTACSEIPDPVKVNAIILNDERCENCDVTALVAQLESIFPGLVTEEIDYSDPEGRELYEASELTALPAILFDYTVKDGEGYSNVQGYLDETGDYLSLRIGAQFDPTAEICDNGEDDNGDGNIDCDDPTCEGDIACMEICDNGIDDTDDGMIDCDDPDCDGAIACMPKLDKPEVELFVMSHCPFGTQIEKGILPVAELLGDKIDLEIKFCDYTMHGEKELDEELLQYCIQKDFNDMYLDYLECFLAEGDSDSCLAETGIDTTQLDVCVKATDEEYGVKENFADESTWLSGYYPIFTVYQEEVDEYGIGGSPSFVLNGVPQTSGRSPQALLDTICSGFTVRPEECGETLSSETPASGFGYDATASGASASGGCGA